MDWSRAKVIFLRVWHIPALNFLHALSLSLSHAHSISLSLLCLATRSNANASENKTMLTFYSLSVTLGDYAASITSSFPMCEVHWNCPPGFACSPGSASKVRFVSAACLINHSIITHYSLHPRMHFAISFFFLKPTSCRWCAPRGSTAQGPTRLPPACPAPLAPTVSPSPGRRSPARRASSALGASTRATTA